METIKLIQFKDYKNYVKHDLLIEIELLKKLKANTFNPELEKMIDDSLYHIMDSNRPANHREFTLTMYYIYYLEGFFAHDPFNFDLLYKFLVEDNGLNDLIEIRVLRDLKGKELLELRRKYA